MKGFFAKVPPDSGIAFVIVVHLSPDHESHLADILQPSVKIPVEQVTQTVELEGDHVYLIPPNANLDAIDSHLRLSELETRRQERAPVDHFFRTLAETHDGHAVGVILSGTGSDGALGIKAIKEKGGLTIVQLPTDAEYDGMPQSAIATGLVDLVLPVDSIPEAVLRFVSTTPRIAHIEEADGGDQTRSLLQKIFAQIRARTGRDFTRYKRSTILRRVARRMQLHQIEELASYLDLLRSQPDEIHALADDLLITVTNFFRDPAVFAKLESDIVPRLFERKGLDGELRVWVVGCATGEEAYSLAMLLLEEAARREVSPRLQVFASDLHEQSLERARHGFYPGDIETDVSPERLRRFFMKEDGGYRIRKEVREIVVFAPHNLLSDPPFSRIDLISCRNLLIYLQRDAQQEVDELFHYALRPEGYLLLGGSETATRSDLFVAEGKKSSIFRKRDVPTPEPRLPVFPLWRNNVRGPEAAHSTAAPQPSYGHLHQQFAERYAPPSVLVGPDDKVVHLSENAGRYLVHPGGDVTSSVFKLAREELRLDLHAGLSEARHGRISRSRPIRVHFNGDAEFVVLHVRPCSEPTEAGFVLVIFDEWEDYEEMLGSARAEGDDREPDRIRLREIETELDYTRQKLQTVIEEYETGQEEMRAANEELQSANEELRSTMEELETGKEELHSMNEELQTVNQENRHKVEELSQLSGDLTNLLASTEIATLFLDKDLRIMRFTPKVTELFNVRMTDRGRPLSDITHRLGYEELSRDAIDVLGRLIPIQREVIDQSGRCYLARILPYRSSSDRIDGVVITFVDVTATKEVEDALRRSEERASEELRAMVQLHELVGRLFVCRDIETALAEVLDATVSITRAEMGSVHLLDSDGMLKIASQRGFARNFQSQFDRARSGDSYPWSKAHDTRMRVAIEDAQAEGPESPHRELAVAAGYRGVQSTPLLSRAGDALGVLSTFHARPFRPTDRDLRNLDLYSRQASDFVERVRSTDALNEKTRALEEEDERKGFFLATLGHELRNPLSVLANAVQLLANGMAESELHPMIATQVGHMKRLVEDLLDVSRMTRGTMKLQRGRTDLAAVVRSAAEAVSAEVGVRQRDLVLSLEKTLPVHGDEVRLEQIVRNLVENAFKYSVKGQRISVTLRREGDEAIIEVRDQGRGIERDDLKPIFDPFAQREPGRGGLGIGLAVVQRLVEMHGGSVVANSEGATRGSTFTVRIPIGHVDEGAIPTRTDGKARRFPPATRILIIEDGRDTADSLALLLRAQGAEVRCAYTGIEGIEQARTWKPHVALIDVGLPDMTGYEVGRRVGEKNGDRTLRVAVTGFGDAEVENRATEAGFSQRLVKPIDLDQLHALVAEYLDASPDAPRSRK